MGHAFLMPDPSPPRSPADGRPGLSTAEAQARLKQFGPNAVVEEKPHPLRQFLRRFWAPIPWLLEATIVIQLFLGERVEAAVIGALLVLNAAAEPGPGRPCAESARPPAPAAPRRGPGAAGRRLGHVPAEELVPGDIVHLRQGAIAPADVRVDEGSLLADQSALTGESAAVTVEPGKTAYAGCDDARGRGDRRGHSRPARGPSSARPRSSSARRARPTGRSTRSWGWSGTCSWSTRAWR